MKRALIVVTVLLLLFLGVDSALPGLKATITNKGLEYARTVGMSILHNLIPTIHIADIHGDAKTPIGDVEYDVTQITLHSLQFPNSVLKTEPGKGIDVALSGISASISANWHYRKKSWPHLSGHGSADIAIGGVAATVNIGFKDVNGEPGCSVLTDAVTVGSFSCKIHGSEGWMINIFLDLFKNKIKDAVTKGIKQGIEKGIDDNLNHVLSTLPLKQNIKNIIIGDFTLVDAPRFGPNFMVMDLKGEFYGVKHPQEPPFQPVPTPDIQNTNVMVQFTIAQFVPDSATFALWKDGLLVLHVTDSMIPPDSPVRFNTDSFKFIIPQLYNAFPSKALEANISPLSTPLVTFEASSMMNFQSSLEMIWYAVVSAGNLQPAMTLGIDLIASGKVSLVNKALFVNMTFANVTLSLRSSNIGPVDITPLNDIALLAVSEGIPFINEFFKNGFPLPQIPQVQLVNPYLGYGNGFIYVNTDIIYTPTTSAN